MKHILFIDPLEKLVIKKDSSLMLALTMKNRGIDVGLVFENDFFFSNDTELVWKIFDFEGKFAENGFYLDSFELKTPSFHSLDENSTIHMRIDPPFDKRYLRYLWMLKGVSRKTGSKVINSPEGIMLYNEKLYPYQESGAMDSFIGGSVTPFLDFCQRMKKLGHEELILKPLDLYQGIGVEKVELGSDLSLAEKAFRGKVNEYGGAVVAQPFAKEVRDGEVRSVYFKGVELGSILKVPPEGEFLANIAQGATYRSYELNSVQRTQCEKMAEELSSVGVDWIAYDILGDFIQEVNITCPGLMVEVSKAVGRNLCEDLVDQLES